MPRVHDMRAIREDRPLYQDLYRRTAMVAAPAIRAAMDRVTAGEAATLFESQLKGLQQFLLEGQAAGGSHEFGPEFGRLLQTELARTGGDDDLCRELSEELARALWDSLLMQMSAHSKLGNVARADLLPTDELSEGNRWSAVFENLDAYSLRKSDVGAIVRAVLMQLADAAGEEKRIRLPLSLSIDKAMLVRLLNGEQEPAEPNEPKGMMEMLRELVNFTR